jgi:hypothetical protein
MKGSFKDNDVVKLFTGISWKGLASVLILVTVITVVIMDYNNSNAENFLEYVKTSIYFEEKGFVVDYNKNELRLNGNKLSTKEFCEKFGKADLNEKLTIINKDGSKTTTTVGKFDYAALLAIIFIMV